MTNFHPIGLRIGGGTSVSGDSAPPPVDLGAANFRKDIFLGLTQGVLLSGVIEENIGLSAIQYPAELLVNEQLGLSVDTFASGTSNSEQNAGLTQGNVLVMNSLPEKSSGFSIDQISYDYVGSKYVQTATNVGADSFSNPTNAQGAPNGTFASGSGNALGARSYDLECTHVDANNKTDLTIDAVELRFYARQTGTVLNNGNMTFYWRFAGGGWNTLATYNNNQDFTSTPDVFDITGSITSWTDINNIETRVTLSTNALATPTVDIDAITVHIEASLVD